MLERALWMPLLGAALGLAMAAQSLFSAQAGEGAALPPGQVAQVNGRAILMSDFVSQVQTLSGQPFAQTALAQRRRVLDDMVREELFVQRALEMDFAATDSDTRNALVAALEQQVVAEVELAPPDDAQLRAWFERHAQDFQSIGSMRLRWWSAGPQASQQALRQALVAVRGGAAVEATLAQAGLQRQPLGDEDLYDEVLRAKLGPALLEQARLLATGAVSEPLRGADGSVHVLQMLAHQPARPRPFEQARADVLKAYLREQSSQRKQATEAYLRSKARIRLDSSYAAH